ncbi:MAG: class I SAM-dependent methyltransferase [Vicinamibacterales bacterium]
MIRSVIGSYSDLRARLYCRLRFQILRQRFLEEIGQYLPFEGSVVDIGCGFGLFGLYFGITRPGIHLVGLDKQPRRIEMARAAASHLNVHNVRFEVSDAEIYVPAEPIHAAYMMDILHHIPRPAAYSLLSALASKLAPGGRLVIKDIETTPGYKRWFTWALDKGMDWRAPVDYWNTIDVKSLLTSLGLSVVKHSMVDYLPYPHVIYVATKRPSLD